jgi:hypothetical protein
MSLYDGAGASPSVHRRPVPLLLFGRSESELEAIRECCNQAKGAARPPRVDGDFGGIRAGRITRFFGTSIETCP